jgi:hypothetical protein
MSNNANPPDQAAQTRNEGHRLAMPCDVSPMPFSLYRPYRPLTLPDRTWPDRDSSPWPPDGRASTSVTATRRWSIPWTPSES